MQRLLNSFIVLLLISLSFSTPVLAENPPLKNVTLQLKWKHQFQFAGYYMAIKKGFYRDAGMKVQLKEFSPDSNVANIVLSGEADFGIMDSDLIRIRSQGAPVVALGVIYQHSPLALVASSNSGIKELHQLKDKRVSLETHSVDIHAMLKTANLKESDIKASEHHFNPNAILTDQVDAMSVYTTDEIFLLRQANFNYRLFSPRNYGIDLYGDTLFTTEKMIKNHPNLVEKFRAASSKGWKYAISHADEAVNYILETYGTRHSRDHLLFEAQNTMDLMQSDILEVGYMHLDRWKHIYNVYKSVDIVKNPVNFESFIYKSKQDNKKFYNVIIVISIILLGTAVIAVTYILINKKLKHQVNQSNLLKQQLKGYAADLKRSNDALESFATIASHDLQEPLRKIIFFGEKIKQIEGLETQGKHYIERMQAAVGRMQNFIKDLLELSKINSNPKPFKSLDLNKIISEVLTDMETRIEETKANIIIETLPRVLADKFQIRQLFLNLISNAIKFHREGVPPKIEIKSKSVHDGFWEISFKDNGVGFEINNAEKILKPFERLHGRSKYEGTGIGLAICDKIIERHGGHINIQSSPGQGSTFCVSLPNVPETELQ
jgi:signal transduction histidine kinase